MCSVPISTVKVFDIIRFISIHSVLQLCITFEEKDLTGLKVNIAHTRKLPNVVCRLLIEVTVVVVPTPSKLACRHGVRRWFFESVIMYVHMRHLRPQQPLSVDYGRG